MYTFYFLFFFFFFFFNDTATTEIYTLSLHDALPISDRGAATRPSPAPNTTVPAPSSTKPAIMICGLEHPGFGGDSILPRCSGLGGRCLPRYRRLAEPRSDHFPLIVLSNIC